MPSYEVCQHCSHSVRTSEAVFRQGYSYHRRCRKCYVCSETELLGAEVFRGVIFCASCAKRIFKGCSTARQAKPARGEPQHRRRRRRARNIEHGIIERARAASTNSRSISSLESSKAETAVPGDPRVSQNCYCVSDVVTQARRLINFIYYQTQNLGKQETIDIAQCSEVCQRMIEDLKCPIPEPQPQVLSTPQQTNKNLRNTSLKVDSTDTATSPPRTRFRSRRRNRKNKKMKKEEKPCSDPRIAELGASVEIATMALRKASTKKVQSELNMTEIAEKSKTTEKVTEPETISMFSNIDSVLSHTSNEEYLDSECQDYRGSQEAEERGVLDIILNGIIKVPCTFFKKKILKQSSLISVFVGINGEKESAYRRLKMLFQDEVLDHQHNGYKKLYSIINKNMTPYKLGWLETDLPRDYSTFPCKHFLQSHSYRCMRRQVMSLAGPTESKMCAFRNRVKKVIVPPFLKNLSLQYKTPASVKNELGDKSDSRVSKISRTSKTSRMSSSSQGQPRSSRSTQGHPRSRERALHLSA